MLLLALGVRLWATGHARFTAEEASFFETALKLSRGEAWPAYGPPLTGQRALHPGPLFFQLIALPLKLIETPRAGAIFVGLLHALSLALVADLVRRLVSPAAAIMCLVLGAFAPWDILYADRIWLSCVAPVFGVGFVYAAGRVSLGGKARWQLILACLWVTLPQLHLSAPVAWLAGATLVMLGPRVTWVPRALLGGVLLGACFYLAPLWAELESGFQNTQALLSHGGSRPVRLSRMIELFFRALGYAVLSGSAEVGYHFERGYWFPFDERAYYLGGLWWTRVGPVLGSAVSVSMGLAVVGWGWSLARLARSGVARVRGVALPGEARLVAALLVGLMGAAVLLGGSGKAFYPHYINLLFPLSLVPVAIPVSAWLVHGRKVLIVLGVSASAMLSNCVRYYLEVDGLNGLHASEALTERLLEASGGEPLRLEFTGHDNHRALESLAGARFGQKLLLTEDARAVFTVDNDGLGKPRGAWRVGAVGLEEGRAP